MLQVELAKLRVLCSSLNIFRQVRILHMDEATLLLYLLLHRNPGFRNFVLADEQKIGDETIREA